MPGIIRKQFRKAERICEELDGNPRLWLVYGETIREILRQAEDAVGKRGKNNGSGPSKARWDQAKWKELLWENRPHLCELCGDKLIRATHQLHHRIAFSAGGATDASNLMVLCPTCHALQHAVLNGREV